MSDKITKRVSDKDIETLICKNMSAWIESEDDTSDGDWQKLGKYTKGNAEYRKDWSPRNSFMDMTLMIFSETAEYFRLGDNLDVAIATIDNSTYIVVDWEKVESAEETDSLHQGPYSFMDMTLYRPKITQSPKSIAFRIKNQKGER